jgi:hypothetical protein
VGLHDDAVVVVVVAHAEGGDPAGSAKSRRSISASTLPLGCAQLGDEAGQIVAERLHLSLLALERVMSEPFSRACR